MSVLLAICVVGLAAMFAAVISVKVGAALMVIFMCMAVVLVVMIWRL